MRMHLGTRIICVNREMEEENDALKHKITELEEEMNTMKTQIEDGKQMQAEFNALRANSEISKKQIDEYEQRIKELQAKEDSMKKESMQLQQTIGTCCEELNMLRRKLSKEVVYYEETQDKNHEKKVERIKKKSRYEL
eukprot:1041386_1